MDRWTRLRSRDAARLRKLFLLSPTEADIAVRIASGESADDIAAARAVSTATVRSQIKTIAQKLDVSRQNQIAAKVRSITPVNTRTA